MRGADEPFTLAPMADETPSAHADASSSAQMRRRSMGSMIFGISSRELAGVMPQSECATDCEGGRDGDTIQW